MASPRENRHVLSHAANEARSMLQCGQNLGMSAEIGSRNLGPNRGVELIRAQGADQVARTMSIYLGIVIPPTALEAENAVAPIAARIRYGQAGSGVSFDVDWAQGTIITIPTSYVEVKGYVLESPTGAAPFEFSGVEIHAAIVEGERGGALDPTLTTPVFSVGAAVLLPVPAYAKAVWFMGTADPDLGTLEWSFRGGTTAVSQELAAGDAADLPALGANPIRIPAHARSLLLTNAGDAVDLSVQWFLEL